MRKCRNTSKSSKITTYEATNNPTASLAANAFAYKDLTIPNTRTRDAVIITPYAEPSYRTPFLNPDVHYLLWSCIPYYVSDPGAPYPDDFVWRLTWVNTKTSAITLSQPIMVRLTFFPRA